MFPIVLPSLVEASNFHWDKTIKVLATSVVENFVIANPQEFNDIVIGLKQKKKLFDEHQEDRAKTWYKIEKKARSSEMFDHYKKSLKNEVK